MIQIDIDDQQIKKALRRLEQHAGNLRPAFQQFGAAEGAFGETTTGHPIPWGDIPARPFIGLSDKDEAEILNIITSYMGDLTS
ncbi:MAG: phage virion morphogenesis protein [Halothiobacillus sp.]